MKITVTIKALAAAIGLVTFATGSWEMDARQLSLPSAPKIVKPSYPGQAGKCEATAQKALENNRETQSKLRERLLTPKFAPTSGHLFLNSTLTTNDDTQSPDSKEEYAYDKNGWPTLQSLYQWDTEKNEWVFLGENGYEWSDNGIGLAKWQLTPYGGSKTTWTFNANGKLTAETSYTFADNAWIESSQRTYAYNEAGHVTELFMNRWNAELKEWQPVEKHYGEYDSRNRLTKETTLELNEEGEWIPKAEIIEYNDLDSVTSVTYQIHDVMTSDDLTNYMQRRYEYGKKFLEKEYIVYWNKSLKSWVGQESYNNGPLQRNGLVTYTYDEKDRKIDEAGYMQFAIDGEYILVQDYKWTFEDKPDGAYNVTEESGFTDSDNELIISTRRESEYLSWGGLTRATTWQMNNVGKMKISDDWVNVFNDDRQVMESKIWFYDLGDFQSGSRFTYEYEPGGGENITRLLEQVALNPENIEGWQDLSLTETEYHNGSTITKWTIQNWNETFGEWEYDRKLEYDYDYSIPGENLTAWTTDWDFMPRTEKVYYFNQNTTKTFNFSESPEAAVEAIEADIDAPEHIYNLQGTELHSSLNNLPAGIYIVRKGNRAHKVAIK